MDDMPPELAEALGASMIDLLFQDTQIDRVAALGECATRVLMAEGNTRGEILRVLITLLVPMIANAPFPVAMLSGVKQLLDVGVTKAMAERGAAAGG